MDRPAQFPDLQWWLNILPVLCAVPAYVQSPYRCACQIIYYIRALYSSATVRQVARIREIVCNETSSSTFDLGTPLIFICHSCSLVLFHFNLIISSLNISLINFSTSLTFTSKCIFREKFSTWYISRTASEFRIFLKIEPTLFVSELCYIHIINS